MRAPDQVSPELVDYSSCGNDKFSTASQRRMSTGAMPCPELGLGRMCATGGLCEMEDPETGQKLKVDAQGFRSDYVKQVESFRETIQTACQKTNVDYVPLDTSMQFDKALLEYLVSRRSRF